MASGSTALRSAVDPTRRRPNLIAVPPDDHESIVDHHARRTRAGLRPRRSPPPVPFAASGPLAKGGRRAKGNDDRAVLDIQQANKLDSQYALAASDIVRARAERAVREKE